MSDYKFDLGGDFEDINYKSCFARSVALNASYKQTKSSIDAKNDVTIGKGNPGDEPCVRGLSQNELSVRMRKNSRSSIDEMRRLSCGSLSGSIRRSSICSNRSADISVENIVQQSKINTLQWQLREIEKSREMYRAVMRQVVSFLEKTHHSLELLGNRMNTTKQSVPRTRSDNQMALDNEKTQQELDIAWRKSKKSDITEEIPPEKLAQEAFRLLRTAQSLLNTREPDLVKIKDGNEPENDMEFLTSLAKEFPQTPDQKPQRQTSFSLSPKLIMPDNEVKVSTAFNRKLSLQFSETRRNSLSRTYRNVDSARGSFAENETDFISSTLNDFSKDFQSLQYNNNRKLKESEKSNSPPAGSVSSVEDESGFSSMNSFQDIGVPLVNSTIQEEVSAKSALLRSMLQNNNSSTYNSLEPNSLIDSTLVSNNNPNSTEQQTRVLNIEDIKLWQTPSGGAHKRWHSNPVGESNSPGSMKVLWV